MSNALTNTCGSGVAQRLPWGLCPARTVLLRLARRIEDGQVVLLENGHATRFDGQHNPLDLRAVLTVHDPRFYWSVLLGGSIGAGEAYRAGWWSCDDVATLTRILVRNSQLYSQLDNGWLRFSAPIHRGLHWLRANNRRNSRRNIAAHYDLGNEFFSLFLDPSMAYSAGIFDTPDTSMLDASEAKFERICQKLALVPGDHLLEIGTGWGGFAVYAARHFGCKVTTTTLSAEQRAEALRRVAEAGLSDRVTVLLQDYRDLSGEFDKLVSIEMVEAVGWEFLPIYFGKCSSLLHPAGRMVLQGITAQDQGYDRLKRTPDFINRYIFPGGCLPSTQSIMQAVAQQTDLRLIHLEDNAPHYALTLLRWREAFRAQSAAVRALGFDEAFTRTWDFYLSLCAGAFTERRIGSVQLVLSKPQCRAGAMNLPALADLRL